MWSFVPLVSRLKWLCACLCYKIGRPTPCTRFKTSWSTTHDPLCSGPPLLLYVLTSPLSAKINTVWLYFDRSLLCVDSKQIGWQLFWNTSYLHLHRVLSGLRSETFGFNRLWSEVVGEMYKPLNLASFASQSSCAILFPCLFLQCHFDIKIPRRNTTKCNIPQYNSTPHNVILLKCQN